jgi:succinate dehydrogenase/fumarate reductase flavoprotein subunit
MTGASRPISNNTDDGIRAGLAIGARTALMSHSWWAPTTHGPGEEKQRALFVERTLPGCILVNPAGERFVNEAAPYTDIRLFVALLTSRPAWSVRLRCISLSAE